MKTQGICLERALGRKGGYWVDIILQSIHFLAALKSGVLLYASINAN